MAGAIQGGWHVQAGLWPQRPLSQQIGIPLAPQKRPIAADCDEHFFTQTLDHFRHSPDGGEKTFQQRYFICSDYWDPAGAAGAAGGNIRSSDGGGGVSKRRRGGKNAREGAKGPIFFYAGNEADVTLYLEATGLMWENAPAFRALLVFAEHRFYGESLPFGAPDKGREFLSTSQALADYALLITSLRRELEAETTPVIAFGGSYGGMLAAWLRLKYPHLVQGAVAASAPVLAVEGLRRPTPDPESFAETVTRAAGPAGGAAEECSANVRRAFAAILSGAGAATGSTPAAAAAAADAAAAGDVVVGPKLRDLSHGESPGAMTRDDARSFEPELVVAVDAGGNAGAVADAAVDRVARLLRVCPDRTPAGEGALEELAWWARAAFDYLAMGNYPYPTGYILNGGGVELPAWPLKEACSRVSDLSNVPAGKDGDEMLLKALADAIGIYYNATGDLECFSPDAGANNASAIDAQNWNWQACTEMSMPMSTDGKRDMFWSAPWDPDAQAAQCLEQFGVSPREGWAAAEYGGYDSWSQVSNIVFSNGRLDPWSGMGVVDAKQAGPGVRVIMMDKAAHHLDLFFEHPLDPQEVSLARREEMDLVEKWVEEAYLVDAYTFTESEGDGDDVVSHPDGEIRGVSAASSGEQKRSSPLLSWLDRFPALVADW